MRLIVVAPSVRSMAAGSGFTSRLLRGLCACGHFVKCFSEPLEVWRGHCTCRSGTTREGVTRPLVAIDGQLLTAMSTWLRCCVECLGELCPRAQQGKTCKPMAKFVRCVRTACTCGKSHWKGSLSKPASLTRTISPLGWPMGAYGGLWGPMGTYGGLWGPMGAYGGLWGVGGGYFLLQLLDTLLLPGGPPPGGSLFHQVR